jgi:hypothetical protein
MLHASISLVGDRIDVSMHCGRSMLAMRGSRGLWGAAEMRDGTGGLEEHQQAHQKVRGGNRCTSGSVLRHVAVRPGVKA